MPALTSQQLETMQDVLLGLNALPQAPMGIRAALDQLEQGDTQPAEELFALLVEQRAAEGPGSWAAAAEAACHLGDLASTHDGGKAVSAYLKAVQLDPEASPLWNRLGAALAAEGKPDLANLAFRKALAFAVLENDLESSGLATCGVGELAINAADLAKADKWWNYALDVFTQLGRDERCAWVRERLATVAGLARERSLPEGAQELAAAPPVDEFDAAPVADPVSATPAAADAPDSPVTPTIAADHGPTGP